MFISWAAPTPEQIDAVIRQSQTQSYTYPDIGITESLFTTVPVSTTYAMDHNRIKVGTGQEIFTRAKQALIQWRMCNLGWANICGTNKPIDPGAVIACVPNLFGIWFINPCRVVYNIDESVDDVTRFGLAYGTLPGHAAMGEERFLVEWYHADDSVWYDILAFSRPGHLLAQLGHPVMRLFQKRYGRDSEQMMAVNCAKNGCAPVFGIAEKDSLNRPQQYQKCDMHRQKIIV